MNKPRCFYKDTYHHVFNRGVNKQLIFFEEKNYQFFTQKLKSYKEKYKISIICYVLMPNHFHLFLKQLTQEFTIGKFVGDLTNSYTKAINKNYDRSGVLFQGRSKNKLINKENYFIWLSKYIHLNPYKAGIEEKLGEWKYSSLPEYLNIRKNIIVDRNYILIYFMNTKNYRDFLLEKDDFDYNVFF